MKIRFCAFEQRPPGWVEVARQDYLTKLKAFSEFEIVSLKNPEMLLKSLKEKDLLVLFDERGQRFASSETFTRDLNRLLESGKQQLVFCIGGPYGFDPQIRERSQAQWSLSDLTLNHWLAQVVALEQLYRGWTIIKGIPYHNP